jgi:hypothetical protein
LISKIEYTPREPVYLQDTKQQPQIMIFFLKKKLLPEGSVRSKQKTAGAARRARGQLGYTTKGGRRRLKGPFSSHVIYDALRFFLLVAGKCKIALSSD